MTWDEVREFEARVPAHERGLALDDAGFMRPDHENRRLVDRGFRVRALVRSIFRGAQSRRLRGRP